MNGDSDFCHNCSIQSKFWRRFYRKIFSFFFWTPFPCDEQQLLLQQVQRTLNPQGTNVIKRGRRPEAESVQTTR